MNEIFKILTKIIFKNLCQNGKGTIVTLNYLLTKLILLSCYTINHTIL